jgi:hypothetical protein
MSAMDKIKAQSLINRYSSSTSAKSGGKEMDVAGRGGRENAMRAGGKPKNLRKTVSRLLNFLSKQRLLLMRKKSNQLQSSRLFSMVKRKQKQRLLL